MVDDMLNLLGMEFMQYGNCYGTIGESCQKCHSPTAHIAAAYGNLVAFLNTAIVKDDMQFCYLFGNITIL